MKETTLNALMRLFAIIANINVEEIGLFSKNFVESYLKTQFSQKIVKQSLNIFEQNFKSYSSQRSKINSKRTSSLSVQILHICHQINQELHVKDKYLILFSLLRFSKFFEEYAHAESEFKQTVSDAVKTISDGININDHEYLNCNNFLNGKFYKIPDKKDLLIVSEEKEFNFSKINHLHKPQLSSQIFFLRISQADLLIFYYKGNDKLELNNKIIFPNHINILHKGSAIKGENLSPIYYNHIETAFLKNKQHEEISLAVRNIEYFYPKSKEGIKKLSFLVKTGELVGIMGGSGTGKSTLMKVLNGSLSLKNGEVLINGHLLIPENKNLKGLIGYVPQDDLLIEELTVYENLYYSASLCLGNKNKENIQKIVLSTLSSLELLHIKDKKVGSQLNRLISGGQRKRLNIALELIREPYILYVDEPTSGLSSTDSEKVMQLLKMQALTGKIVLVNIHQPSSDIFKMFDQILLLDQGGYSVFFGNPVNAFSYLKSIVKRVDAHEFECQACGNVQTEDVLKIIESKKVDEFGEYTSERYLKPQDWYNLFTEKETENNLDQKIGPIPELKYTNPSHWKQFTIFSLRNFFSRIADKQFLLFSLLISPLLALILGFFTKNVEETTENTNLYNLSTNDNIPAYIFMSVIVALFVGLVVSVEEIYRDRLILARESYLNLSRFAYLNSKILFLFVLSALQCLFFVLIGNNILEIKDLNLSYWIALFSSACFAVLLGLNVSSSLKSITAIYINIPFILVPLILLAGVIVEFDKLHYKVTSAEYVPVAGDLMASRWAYEALVVNQFLNNQYQIHFNEVDEEKANSLYYLNSFIPKLTNHINDYEKYSGENSDQTLAKKNLLIIQNSITNIPELPKEFLNSSNQLDTEKLRLFLENYKIALSKRIKQLNYKSDEIIQNLMNQGNSSYEIIQLQKAHQNKSIKDLVLNTNDLKKASVRNMKIIRNDSPVFQKPESKTGRAQFYAGKKVVGNIEIETFWFNIVVIWIMCIMLYISLLYESIKKIIEAAKNILNYKFRQKYL